MVKNSQFHSLEEVESAVVEMASSMAGSPIESSIALESLGSLGIDSLAVVQLICEAEQRYGVSVTNSSLETAVSLKDIAHLIHQAAIDQTSPSEACT